MPSPILCLGAINLDLKFQVDDLEGFLKDWGTGLSRGGEEAVSREDEARLTALLARYGRPAGRFGGGMAANTAYALACLGLPVGLVGRVGADADGEFLKESLAGVDLSHVVAQGESGRAYILTDREGERTILVAPNTNDDLKERDLPWEALAAATFLHLTAFVGDGPLAVQRTIAGRVPDTGPAQPGPGGILRPEGVAGPGRHPGPPGDPAGHGDRVAAVGGRAEGAPQLGPAPGGDQAGARGARLLTPPRYLDFPVELGGDLVDTLGAGDVFAAGYLAGRLSGLHLNACVRLGNRAAAVSLRGAGRDSYPDRNFLERQVQALQGL